MSVESFRFRDKSADFESTWLAIWLRLMAVNLETVSSKESIITLRNEWMNDSRFTEYALFTLDQLKADIEDIEIVLKVAARLVSMINLAGGTFRGDFLSLLGLQSCISVNGGDWDASRLLRLADQFVRLICSHEDTMQKIIDRHTYIQERKGPPCPYCGVKLFHPLGKQCLECGWDWHDAENPVHRKGGPAKEPAPIACLVDGGNPFDETGKLRRLM